MPPSIVWILSLVVIGAIVVALYAMVVGVDSLIVTSCVGVSGTAVGVVGGWIMCFGIVKNKRKHK